MEMAAAVRKCATFIEEKIGKHIDVTTMAYNRLMNHIRHMVSRAATGEKLKVDLNQFIEKNYPESFALAGDICKELGKDLNHEFLDNETGYLAIHIEQIKCDEMVSEKNVKTFLHIRLCTNLLQCGTLHSCINKHPIHKIHMKSI